MDEMITELDIVLRLCLGFIAGGIIGFERSSHRQIAGLRTHILICVGATSLMLLSIWLPEHFFGLKNGDPGRIAAQVVSGMGFLGAGAIIRLGSDIKGLTTAASLWLIAAIGLLIGAGMYLAAGVTEAVALVTLVLLGPLERRIFPDIRQKLLEVQYNHSGEPNTENVLEIFKTYNVKNQSLSVQLGHNKKKTRASFSVSILDTVEISRLAHALQSLDEIERVEIKERY
jgi:putative Mg2+ transporter-C (MgtC) family protein